MFKFANLTTELSNIVTVCVDLFPVLWYNQKKPWNAAGSRGNTWPLLRILYLSGAPGSGPAKTHFGPAIRYLTP